MDIFAVEKPPPCRHPKIKKFLSNSCLQTILVLFTLYGLFGADVQQAFFDKSADPYFLFLTISCIFTMFLEIYCNYKIDPKYCGSFFFYLDLTCKVTMYIDVDFIKNFVFLGSG